MQMVEMKAFAGVKEIGIYGVDLECSYVTAVQHLAREAFMVYLGRLFPRILAWFGKWIWNDRIRLVNVGLGNEIYFGGLMRSRRNSTSILSFSRHDPSFRAMRSWAEMYCIF